MALLAAILQNSLNFPVKCWSCGGGKKAKKRYGNSRYDANHFLILET